MQEEALSNKLLEYKNPLVITAFAVLLSSAFYFQDVNSLYLVIFCLVIFLFFLFFQNIKFLLLISAIIFSYFYIVVYFKFFTVNLNNVLNQKNIFIGEILSSGNNNDSFYKKYYLKLKDYKSCKVQVVGSLYEEYSPGDIVQITGVLKKPKSALLPGLFDERKFLFTRNVHYILKAESGSLVFLDIPTSSFFKKWTYRLRERIIFQNSKYLQGNNLALVNGVVLGAKASQLSGNLKKKIQSLGLAHITAASGFNVSVLAAGIFYIFHLFYRGNFLPSLISIFVVLLYSSIADFSPSITRASVFITLVLLGNLFDKKLKILPVISLIILLFFLISPNSILDIGLQLSILAFLGLVLFSNEFQNRNPLFLIFLQSLFAQIMIVPLIVFYFHNIQVLGLVSNLLAIPLAGIILITGLITLLFALIFIYIPVLGFLNTCLYFLLKIFSDAFLFWINFLDKVPLKQVFLPNLSLPFLILIYAFILFCLCSLFLRALRRLYRSIIFGFVILLFLIYSFTDTGKHLKIFFIPKYNQESTLILPPDGKPVLLATNFNEKDKEYLKTFLRLNNKSPDFIVYNLNKKHALNLSTPSIKNKENKIEVRYKKFSFDILKTYSEKITEPIDYIKLPMLKQSDPKLSLVFLSSPKLVIVNDYKKLSNKSFDDIKWLKSQNFKTLFLSETGTITLITDGIKQWMKY